MSFSKEDLPFSCTEKNENKYEGSQECSPEIDIVINNVVCTFNLRCHINLRRLAMNGLNVEFKRGNGMVNMKLRRPWVTSNISSSGKVIVTGSTSESEAKVAARRVARLLQKLHFNVRFSDFRIVNILATCSLPFGIKLNGFSQEYPNEASYEPELHPGVTFRIKSPKATLKIFSTGSVTITAPCVKNVSFAVEHIYPLVEPFHMGELSAQVSTSTSALPILHNGCEDDYDNLDELYESEFDDAFDSDVSHD